MTAIWWIRRDLRLHDSPALHAALQHGDVVPLFVLDPTLLEGRQHGGAERRKAFLFAGLRSLDRALQDRGSRLVVRLGAPEDVLPRVAREAGAEAVYAAEDFSPYSKSRDARVARALDLHLTGGIAIHHPDDVLKDDGDPFRVFTPYSRAWLREPPHARDLLEAPSSLPAVPDDLESDPVPDADAPEHFPAGEAEALRRLAAFTEGRGAPLGRYDEDRNRVDKDGTSALSPYLRFGMLSPRQAAVIALGHTGKGAATWLNELIWRDFYLSVLHHFPAVLTQEFDAGLRGIRWRNDPGETEAWQQGRTGYPEIDAAMRQLLETGWMHNRARMLVASFLVKHLLVDWRIGEAWFMQQLVDGDPAANNGGWQWTAGVGTDAAPYFRVFNPVLQGKRFDPKGDYVRRWVPELAGVPDRFVHEPWRMSSDIQESSGVHLGRDYPYPIVDLQEGRARALEAYREARERNGR